ncbi:sulfatase family protein [Rhodohalobacter sp. 614A]|uniref:sulfatase family protein n=1 Tax=Rhodohalobacter sp. 614A TaxID=2908649 RepID=UPI001F3801CD|nr:sulfatase [Rhodohalobacter sp. 614A]
MIKKTRLSTILLAFGLFLAGFSASVAQSQKPNIIILLTDDMGYGDLSVQGHPTIQTPNIDNLASQGIRFTSFETAVWCVPSRTQLMTGRYMPRVDFGGDTGSDGEGGLPDSELTLAEGLKEAGYITGMAGKWHLGYKQKKFLPPNQGFDSWFGLPYSNDYMKPWVQTDEPLGLYRGTEIVEHPFNQDSLTVRYTKEAVDFIEEHGRGEQPFFFYLAYNMPHLPIHTTEEFRGKSDAGLYGDVIETIDWSVQQILSKLDEQEIAENTIVFFASDNGPWLNLPDRMLQAGNKPWHAGSTGHLRGSKATTYEGGSRVPAMIRWPAVISPNQVSDQLVAMPDIYRTMLEAGGGSLPDHTVDGFNLIPFLTGEVQTSPRKEYAYIRYGVLEAMRVGDWKLRMMEENPELFNMQDDPGERFNRAEDHPEIVREIRLKMEEFAGEVGAELPEPQQ